MFERVYEPHLRGAGYTGVYTNKLGKVSEGSATFFDARRYRLLAQCATALCTVPPKLQSVRACARTHNSMCMHSMHINHNEAALLSMCSRCCR